MPSEYPVITWEMSGPAGKQCCALLALESLPALQAQRELKGLRAQHERLSEALSARNEELAGLRARLDAAAPSQGLGEDEDEAWLVQGTAWDR